MNHYSTNLDTPFENEKDRNRMKRICLFFILLCIVLVGCSDPLSSVDSIQATVPVNKVADWTLITLGDWHTGNPIADSVYTVVEKKIVDGLMSVSSDFNKWNETHSFGEVNANNWIYILRPDWPGVPESGLGVGGGIVYFISSDSTSIKLYSSSSYSGTSASNPGWHFNIGLEIDNRWVENGKYDRVVVSKNYPGQAGIYVFLPSAPIYLIPVKMAIKEMGHEN